MRFIKVFTYPKVNNKNGNNVSPYVIVPSKSNNAMIIQLTTNKQRSRAKQFYERLGFKATHEGMKYYIKEKQ